MAKMNPMVSMALDDEDILDMETPIPIPAKDIPLYPYGLKICLTDKEFKKLGVDPKEAFVGGMIHIHAMACITSVSANETQDGECVRVEAQIENMCIESEDDENYQSDADAKPKRSALYDR